MTLPEQKPGSDRQWWLSEGPEACAICEALVHPEMLGYCVLCDQRICYLCSGAWGNATSVFCPHCGEDGQQDRESG